MRILFLTIVALFVATTSAFPRKDDTSGLEDTDETLRKPDDKQVSTNDREGNGIESDVGDLEVAGDDGITNDEDENAAAADDDDDDDNDDESNDDDVDEILENSRRKRDIFSQDDPNDYVDYDVDSEY